MFHDGVLKIQKERKFKLLVIGCNYFKMSFPKSFYRESSPLVAGYPINRPAYRQAGLGYDDPKLLLPVTECMRKFLDKEYR